MGYFPLYTPTGEIIDLPVDPTPSTISSLAILRDGEEMKEQLLLDILGEIRQLYPHHHLNVRLTPMDTLGQPAEQTRSLPLRQAIVTIVERP